MRTMCRLLAVWVIVVSMSLSLGTHCLSATGKKNSPAPTSRSDSMKSPKVEIYITDWCPYCTQAMKFLKVNRIAYKAYNIDTDKVAAERQFKLAGRVGVPFAVINGEKILGFSEQMYKEALGLK